MKMDQPLVMEAQEYRSRRRTELKEWGRMIKAFERSAERAEAQERVLAYYETVDALRSRHKKARTLLHQLEDSDEKTWEALRARADEAFSELEMAIQEAILSDRSSSSET